jgi:hypothetical protein
MVFPVPVAITMSVRPSRFRALTTSRMMETWYLKGLITLHLNFGLSMNFRETISLPFP